MKLPQVKILPLLKSLPQTALGRGRSITDSLRTRYKSTWREVSRVLQGLRARSVHFAEVCKKKLHYTLFTIKVLCKRGHTWKNLVADVARLRNEVARLKQQRANDENLIMNLFRYHDDRADQAHEHPVMLKIVIPAVRLALLRLKNDVQGVFHG